MTGGTGLIGRPLVEMLDNSGANIRIVSLDTPTEMPARTEFISADLREFANCAKAVKDIEVVFHLAGVKGSPQWQANDLRALWCRPSPFRSI